MKIITGENFKELCDLDILHCQNCNTNKKSKKTILNKNFKGKFKNINNIIMCTDLLDDPDLCEKLKQINCKFNLIFHNSDRNFKEKNLIILDNVPNINCIYTQNCLVKNEKVIPIPIGLANSKHNHGNLKIFQKVLLLNIEKKNKIYFYFNIGTNPGERQECFEKIKNKNIQWCDKKNFQEYLKNLKSYQFAISPPGNGIDCHRLWECLYLKVIPICKRSVFTENFSKIFPIIILNDWNDLDINKLDYGNFSWKNYRKLDFEWWSQKIINNK